MWEWLPDFFSSNYQTRHGLKPSGRPPWDICTRARPSTEHTNNYLSHCPPLRLRLHRLLHAAVAVCSLVGWHHGQTPICHVLGCNESDEVDETRWGVWRGGCCPHHLLKSQKRSRSRLSPQVSSKSKIQQAFVKICGL